MASVVLGTVGGAVGGSAGRSLGTLIGGAIDGAGRKGTIRDLNLQSSAYGDAIPQIFGRVRTGGILIWALPLQLRSVGAKGTAARHAYSASFAIALATRPISVIGKVWADGKLMGTAGALPRGVTMRVHTGGERQTPDPLITAAEGVGGAPAHRGVAYVVFEDLDLSGYGNRLPALSFEVVADAVPPDAGLIAAELAETAGVKLDRGPPSVAVAGLLAKGTIAAGLAVAARVAGVTPALTAAAKRFAPEPAGAHIIATLSDIGLRRESTMTTAPDAIAVEYWDADRDYQLGTQRVSGPLGPTARAATLALPVTMAAADARALAARTLAGAHNSSRTMIVDVGAAGLAIAPGDRVQVSGQRWRVRRTTLAGLSTALTLERETSPVNADIVADAGRVLSAVTLVAGATTVELLDLPPLTDSQPPGVRLWVAASGTGAGWRGADVFVTPPGAQAPALAGRITQAAVMGAVTAPPAMGVVDAWDDTTTLEVKLADADAVLQSRADADVLAGGNVALVGDEIVQFGVAESIGPGRFRLHHLLRARRGTEPAMASHRAGERFVMLAPAALLPLDLGGDVRGGSVRVSALGAAETPAQGNTVEIAVAGRSAQALPPVHASARLQDGDLAIAWIDRNVPLAWTDTPDPAPRPMIVEVRGAGTRRLPIATGAARYPAAAMRRDGFDPAQPFSAAVAPALLDPPVWAVRTYPNGLTA